MKKGILILVFILFSAACSGTAPEATEIPTAAPTQNKNVKGWEATATVASFRTRENGGMRFMTFNIFFGGYGWHGDPTMHDTLLSVIQDYDPDVLGIQEANGWDENDFAITKKFAESLNMHYSYCKSANLEDKSKNIEDGGRSFDSIIFSKYEIVDSESYPEVLNCFGRMEILLPDGQPLQVFNIHSGSGKCKTMFPKMLEITEAYMDSMAVIMGDFNVVDPDYVKSGENYSSYMDGCSEMMEESGWVWLKSSRLMGAIDQIWVNSPMKDFEYVTRMHRTEFLSPQKNINLISDHDPTAADIYFP